MGKITSSVSKWLINFLTCDIDKPRAAPLSDFNRLIHKVEICDVVLVEGRSRSSRAISLVTRSIWTHSALYIGTLDEQPDDVKMALLKCNPTLTGEHPLIIESNMGEGVVVSELCRYKCDHLRVCRPKGITAEQKQLVVAYVVSGLGLPYDNQQIFDLARFFFPWWILPRKWQSSLFRHNVQEPTKHSCSLLIAKAFISAKFPILPVLEKSTFGDYFEAIMRNPKLFVPADFDYSPFFEIVKYPIIDLDSEHKETILWKKFL